jgi:hypothetical protein
MQWQTATRLVGVVGLIIMAGIAATYGLGDRELILFLGVLVALVAPEALDQLPIGPNK